MSEKKEDKKGFAKTGHLTHLEDMLHHHGNEGAVHAADFLDAIDTHLSGKQKTEFTGQKAKPHILEKGDGAPAIIFGRNPHNGKFFVSTKSLHNKEPKINYTKTDVEKNHGHAPGLAKKLKAGLEHLPKVAPKEGIFQGDYYYHKDDVEEKGGHYHFTPNTITYKTPKNSKAGNKVRNAQIGLMVHTRQRGTINNLIPEPLSDHSEFKEHDDVHIINPSVQHEPGRYTPEHRTDYMNHHENARIHYRKMKTAELDDHVMPHAEHVSTYINSTVRNDTDASHEGYIQHLKDRGQKDIDKYKTPQRKQKAENETANKIKHAITHKKSFENYFELHNHLTKAKESLMNALDNHPKEFKSYIGDKEVGPEGYVVYHANKQEPVKLVRRKGENGFSRLNFAMGKMQEQKKKAQKKIWEETADPSWVLTEVEDPKKWLDSWPERKKKLQQKKFDADKKLGKMMGSQKFKDAITPHPESGLGRDIARRDDFKKYHMKEETHKKGVVFAFGRMNPPTTGHEKLVKHVHDIAKKHNADHEIMVSHSHDSEKNPLTAKQKLHHLKRMHPNTHFTASSKEHPTLLHHAASLHAKGHKELHMIAGSDRVHEYKKLLHKYNGVKGRHGHYKFDKIEVHSAGHRDEKSSGTSGMSASKMRHHAKTGNFNEFKKGVPKHVSHEHAKELYHDTRKGLGIKD